MLKRGKLELTWVGKYDKQEPLEPRILLEKPELSYGDPDSGNMLIHGDNLIALRALEQDFSGKVKCIYIDPPYNTGTAFEHYDDGIEHSLWLSLIRDRIQILWRLLRDDGSLWISIDDYEMPYLRILLDEICGRNNFIACNVWQKRYSRENREAIGDVHEYIIVYAKNVAEFKKVRNKVSLTENQAKVYRNPNNDPKGSWRPIPMTAQGWRPNQMYPITTPSGVVHYPPEGRCWSTVESEYLKLLAEGRIYFGKNNSSQPNIIRYLSEVEGNVPWTWWQHEEVGHTDEAKKEIHALFGKNKAFDTPKPERLVQRVLTIASNPGDLVLDSFLGSGTTAAVAHKMGRRWIGIELGEHAYTHCKARLDKVVDGEQGGISKEIGWQGGGGYKFCELAPSLLEKHPVLPVYRINKEYTFEMLCEAICKLEGFTYKPEGDIHGHSSESRFIHISREFVSGDYITKLMKEVGDKQSVLIYGVKIQSGLRLPDNVEIKKIPKDLLKKCKFESEVR